MTVKNLDAFWMPFTPNNQFKANPRLVASALGIWLKANDGRDILDASAGLWCVNAGHCRTEIADAVAKQLTTLDYSSIFNYGHELGFEYANRLISYTPTGLDHVFFGNSGSEAVETALKIALQYWAAKGEGQKTRFIGREKSYHGVNFGGLSVGGLTNNHRTFGQWLLVDHLPHTLDIARNAFSKGLPEYGVELAEALENLILFHGPERVAAVIVEPIVGAGGVIMPPQGYLQRLREIATQYNVLLIFDEVICGWGRTGSAFASQEFNVIPDMLTSAKGITNAAIPLSACFVNHEIYQTCLAQSKTPIEFPHGYTYSCHPVACAAGMATLDIYDKEGLLTRASHDGEIATYWQAALHQLADLPNVIDIRNYGLVGGIELKAHASGPGILGARAIDLAWQQGMMIRAVGDTICLSPPLVITISEIDQITAILSKVIQILAES